MSFVDAPSYRHTADFDPHTAASSKRPSTALLPTSWSVALDPSSLSLPSLMLAVLQNAPRPGKKLVVLDLDHCILDTTLWKEDNFVAEREALARLSFVGAR